MFGKKRLAEIAAVSFVLAVSICIIIYNFAFAELQSEAPSGTFLFIALWVCAVTVAYLLMSRFVLAFAAVYFCVTLVSAAMSILINVFSVSYSIALSFIVAPTAAFLGVYAIIPAQYTVAVSSAAVSAAFCLLSFVLIRGIAKKEAATAILRGYAVTKAGK